MSSAISSGLTQSAGLSERVNRRRLREAFALFCVVGAVLLARGNLLLQDPDTYWHLVVGKQIWTLHTVPRIDEFSYTMAGAPWIAKEWLSQVALAAAYAAGGWRGVCILTATVAAGMYVYLYLWLTKRLIPIAALTVTIVAMSLTMGSTLARPQIFYFLFVTLGVCALVDAAEGRKVPWRIVPIVAIWANMHPSFPIIFVLGGLFALEAASRYDKRAEQARSLASWSVMLIAAAAVSGATPYGYEPLLVSFKIFGSNNVRALGEWQPIDFDMHGAYTAAFLAGGLALLAAARAGWLRAAPVLLCGYLMVRHVRFMALYGLVAAASVATPIAKRFPRFATKSRDDDPYWGKVIERAGLVSAVVLAAVAILTPTPQPSAKITPAAGLDAALAAGVSGRVFNDYNFGSYLIFRGVKTFIDGRAELFFGGVFEKMLQADDSKDPASLSPLLQTYHPTWALLIHDSGNSKKFAKLSDWRKIYSDKISDVYVRR